MIIMKGFCEDDFMNFHEMKRVLGRSPNFLLWRHYYRLVVMVHVVIGNPSLSVCQKSGKGVLYSIPFDNYFIVFSLTYQRCFGSCFSLYHFINNLLHQLCIIGVFVEFYWNVRETIFSFQHWSDFYYLSSQEMTCAYEKTKKQTQFKWEISIDYHPKRFLNFYLTKYACISHDIVLFHICSLEVHICNMRSIIFSICEETFLTTAVAFCSTIMSMVTCSGLYFCILQSFHVLHFPDTAMVYIVLHQLYDISYSSSGRSFYNWKHQRINSTSGPKCW